MMQIILKILPAAGWRAAEKAGVFAGAGIDLQDGFIHFSTPEQVRETARLHFAGKNDLVIFAVDGAHLAGGLKWEMSRGGQLFPHYYGALATSEALWVKPLPWNGTAHDFPSETFA